MRKVRLDDLIGLKEYEQIRPRFRERIIAHKRARRVHLGPEMTLVFEDHDTVLSQVQEMLRTERITMPSAVAEELAVYNDLVPEDGGLSATLMIEVEDPEERERRRRELVGLDEALSLELGDVSIRASFDALGRFDDRVAAVRFVSFALPPDGRERLLDPGTTVSLRVHHPRYEATATLSDEARRSLAVDLDPVNAEASRKG
ncbi:MAG: DUF3501 family protein [Myxococcaceae bacterium]|nr:MAG: DUF3501 family protein [Myxococcaceae bacterium]